MALIGALCFGSEFIYREDLKVAIQAHPEWKFPTLQNTPVIQLTRGEFRSSKKSKKMIFVHAEKSKQNDVACVLTKIYDGTSKAYPNGNMSLFIPIGNVMKATPEFRLKIIFNHDKHIGDETLFCIGGFNDLNTHITLKNDKSIPLRILLKNIPALEGNVTSSTFHPSLT